MLHSINKTAVIDISVAPDEYPILILRFVVYKFSNIDIPIDVLKAITILTVILKMAFIES